MNNKKEQERAELHKAIWNIANSLRGSVDGWDFKQYVLGMLFYRYISENIANYIIYSERAGVTWHVLTYPYTITVFIMFGLFFVNNREDEDRQLLFFFAWPMLTLVIAFSLASNQNNLTRTHRQRYCNL